MDTTYLRMALEYLDAAEEGCKYTRKIVGRMFNGADGACLVGAARKGACKLGLDFYDFLGTTPGGSWTAQHEMAMCNLPSPSLKGGGDDGTLFNWLMGQNDTTLRSREDVIEEARLFVKDLLAQAESAEGRV